MAAISSFNGPDLAANAANFEPLSPITFAARAAAVYPDRVAVVHGDTHLTWRQTWERSTRLASALVRRGVAPGDVVAAVLANTPEMLEAHHGVPMAGAVLNSINTRLDAATVALILRHGGAKVLLVDREFSGTVLAALEQLQAGGDPAPLLVDVDDPQLARDLRGPDLAGAVEYEQLLAEGFPAFSWVRPANEWDAIALNYTSGTAADPKGVVLHNRGAYLNSVCNVVTWGMPPHATYLWTLPMFHCNGWCFPWTVAAVAGTHVCLRRVEAGAIFSAIAKHRVTHFCGAPIIMTTLINAPASARQRWEHQVRMMVAASAPPAPVLAAMGDLNIEVTHVYGLTEVYGPATVCAWKEEWDGKPVAEQAVIKARQGVRYHMLEELTVLDPETMKAVPHDGETIGEVMFRGNIVMKGYLKNPGATKEAFEGGYFRSGDLAVVHEDGYIQLKDRSKDIIISGGENISSLEVESVLYRHPAVLEAAVVARPDEKWGETPCAFVELKADQALTEAGLIDFCREHMPKYMVPRTVIFRALPKTITGKVQKFVLRSAAKELNAPRADIRSKL